MAVWLEQYIENWPERAEVEPDVIDLISGEDTMEIYNDLISNRPSFPQRTGYSIFSRWYVIQLQKRLF